MSDLKEEKKAEKTEKEKKIGQFKTNRKYVSFVSTIRGSKVRLIRTTAVLDGSKIYGLLEGVKLKFTICDEGTVDLEEITDTNVTDDSMKKRILEDIDDMETNMYSQKSVISSLTFKDENNDPCYLEVEYKTPMERMREITSDENNKDIEISDKARNAINELFKDLKDEDNEKQENVSEEIVTEDNTDEKERGVTITNVDKDDTEKESESETYIRESIEKAKKEKIISLQNRISDTSDDIAKYKREKQSAEKKLSEVVEQLSILNKRLESMDLKPEPNGYVFFVSEEKKSDVGLTKENREIADKIADIIGLKKDVLFDKLTNGYYEITIGKADDIKSKDVKISEDILSKLILIDTDGKIEMSKNNKLIYTGSLNWHQIVGKMIKLGFEQNDEFDKISGSNSYKENKPKENKLTEIKNKIKGKIKNKF